MLKNVQEESRQERKKRELRQKIIQVAAELFNQQGFENTTMEQIAERADVARKTLYNYFPVKDAIADEYVRDISRGLAEVTSESLQRLPDTRSQLLAAMNNAYGWVELNPELTKVVLRYRMNTSYKNHQGEKEKTGTQNIVNEILRQGQASGEIKPDLPITLMAMYIDLLRGAMVFEWLSHPDQYDIHEEIAKVVDIILYGVSNYEARANKQTTSKEG